MSRHGIAHDDIKPSNIFFRNAGGSGRLDSKGVQFRLGDLDFVQSIGAESFAGTPDYFPPETAIRETRLATTARDLYSLADSIYYAAFGNLPWDDYRNALEIRSPNAPDLNPQQKTLRNEARSQFFSDPEKYKNFLNWVERRLQKVVSLTQDPATRKELETLKEFLVKGLAHDPALRVESLKVAGLTHTRKIHVPIRANSHECEGGFSSLIAPASESPPLSND